MKNKRFIVIINMCVNVLFIVMASAFAWMIIQSSVGEIVEHRARLIVPGVNVVVEMYALVDNEYVLQRQDTPDLIKLKNIEPGSVQRYRFDITNPNEVPAGLRIVLAGISGDVELLDDYITINVTSPVSREYKLNNTLQYDERNNAYYMDLLDAVAIPGNNTEYIYWNVELSTAATKEIEDTAFAIDKILFLNL